MKKEQYFKFSPQKRDKFELTNNEYLLAEVISALSNPVCFTKQTTLGKYVGVNSKSVRNLLDKLTQKGLIVKVKEGYSATDLFDAQAVTNTPQQVTTTAQEAVTSTPLYIYIYSLLNNIYRRDATPDEVLKHLRLPESMGKTSIQRLVRIYSLVWKETYGTPYTANFGKLGKLFKPTLESLTEYQIALLIFLHFRWRGANDDSDWEYKKLENECFPLEWIPYRINQYTAYLVNSEGVKWDDPVEVRKLVVGEVNRIMDARR